MADLSATVPEWVWAAVVANNPSARYGDDGRGPTAAQVLFACIANSFTRVVVEGDELEFLGEPFVVDYVGKDYVVLRSSVEGGGLWLHDEFSEPLTGRLRWPWQS